MPSILQKNLSISLLVTADLMMRLELSLIITSQVPLKKQPDKRTLQTNAIHYHVNDDTEIKNIKKFLTHNLEEGDQLVILNAFDVIHKNPTTTLDVFSTDTDVFVLLTGFFPLIPESTILLN